MNQTGSSTVDSSSKVTGKSLKPGNMVPWGERFSYSLSDFACNLSFQMVSTYLMIFLYRYVWHQCCRSRDAVLRCPVL